MSNYPTVHTSRKHAQRDSNRERRINAGTIADRIMGTLVLVKPKREVNSGATPLGYAKPQAITKPSVRCICCGALAP